MTDNDKLSKNNQAEQSVDDLWNVEKGSATEKVVPHSVIRDSYTTSDKKSKKKFSINHKYFSNILSKIKTKKIKNIQSETTVFNMELAREHPRYIESNKADNSPKGLFYSYVNAPLSASRYFATLLLLSGLIILATLHYLKKIPDAILPLISIGMEDSGDISSAIIPINSDSSFENSGLKQSYEITIVVRKGDTFGNILKRYQIVMNNRHSRLIKDIRKKFNVRKIFVGQQITLYLSGGYFKGNEAKIEKIKFKINEETSVIANWNNATREYNVEEFKEKLSETQKQAVGVINSSLYKAMEQQGVKVGAINSFINLFSFDVDFQRDIRKGDKFAIGFSEYSNKVGKYVRSGNIRYAELSVQGISQRYYKYTTKSGVVDYYDKNGKSGRKALMKTPIEGARLSSSFGRRKHPVLGYTKVHKGTDFVAPKGTPIFAAGDGTVEYAGRNGSFGIYIRLRHNGSYKTAYAHMSGIARGVRTGKRVRQGQIIGYVGTTGRSTGNHLHYEVHKNGVAIDSRRMKLPSGKKLKGTELAEFKKFIQPMLPKN